ncbi:tripartite tricarboxylate transporter TctB family protein [Thalassospiraceae bacterium LMO-SO8]|nr:tripartite tricarboxylate transporter TctB family protein [Alphaproteobacteria bacterium LMO-S08]WND75318.1 tripartite tricarboxylate transporter TctB family protein [Thalassospiraceae bacterium LMO-SO8]
MDRLNRDVYVAVVLLLFCGVMFWASMDIREPDYGMLPPSAWPRVILGVLSLLSVVYLVQSLRRGADGPDAHAGEPDTISGWLSYWRNPIACFVLFACYLAAIPWFGMLISGVAFVFALLTVLGGAEPRKLALHAGISLVTVGGMWSLFTYALRVLLPRGEWTGF